MFASSLSASLANSKASVLLDTTLNALSNQDVTFKNTNTYRYADTEISPDTGNATTTKTITREIVSGIILTLKGWVSGDGMISMTINSTISKRGSASSNGAIPQTYEKVISTSVRTPSGKPIVVGGLMQHDNDNNTNVLYLKDESQNTELMIYIIPRVETPLFFDTSLGDSLMYLYNQYAPNGERQDTL
jgi:type II secretory pathway component GspD/PulD (secretin)